MRSFNIALLVIGISGLSVAAHEAKAVGLVFGCNLQRVPPPVSYFVLTDTSKGEVDLIGSFQDATPPRPEQPVDSIAQLAKKSGLKGMLKKIHFKVTPCRWKVDQQGVQTNFIGIDCSSYDIDVKFTDDQGGESNVRAKSIRANIERVTRESATGTKQTYESSIMLQDAKDQIYRSIEIFSKNGCSVEG